MTFQLTTTNNLPTRSSDNPAIVYLAGLPSQNSRRVQGQALNAIAKLVSQDQADINSFPWSQLRYQHTSAIRSALAERYQPNTANRMVCALKQVLKESRRLGQIGAEDYTAAIDLKTIKGETLPAGRALSADEVKKLMTVCLQDESAMGRRDAAMLVLLRAGLRRSEVVGVNLDDYNPTTGELRVRGKGRKERLCYVPATGMPIVGVWLEVRSAKAGRLLLPIAKGGTVQWRKLTDQAVLTILSKRVGEAGIADCSPHDLRRTFATDLLGAGIDIAIVQRLMGHSSITTTQRYDKRGEDAKRRAVDKLGF